MRAQYEGLGEYGGESYGSYRSYLMAAEQSEGFVSGFREIIAKARAAKSGDIGAMGEIEAAKTLRESGQNVHFQTPTGKRSYLGNTADFLVGGDQGTGLNGIPKDVLTPLVGKRGSVISGIANKTDQAQHIIVNLRHANPRITAAEIGSPNDVVNEIINGFANSHSTAKYLRSIEFQE